MLRKIVFVFLISFFLAIAVNADLKSDEQLIDNLDSITTLYLDHGFLFWKPIDEIRFLEPLINLHTLKQSSSNDEVIERDILPFVSKALLILKISVYYMDKISEERNLKINYHPYNFKIEGDDIYVRLEPNETYQALIEQFDFLEPDGNEGIVKIEKGKKEHIKQFAKLEEEFYMTLQKAAQLNSKDLRVKIMAKWGNRYRIYDARKELNKGGTTKIITDEQYNGLNLGN